MDSSGKTDFSNGQQAQLQTHAESFGRKCKCLLIVLAKLLYLNRVGRADFSGCHLEEIWLFVTELFHLNGNMRKTSAFLGDRMCKNVIIIQENVIIIQENVIIMRKNVIMLDFLLKLKENWACNELKQNRGLMSHNFKCNSSPYTQKSSSHSRLL